MLAKNGTLFNIMVPEVVPLDIFMSYQSIYLTHTGISHPNRKIWLFSVKNEEKDTKRSTTRKLMKPCIYWF